MLAGATPVAFVSTADPERARTFYRDILGLPLLSEDGLALVFDLGATTLRVTVLESLRPQPFTVLGWHVDDAGAAVRALTAAGVAFERYDGMGQDELGVWTAPSGTRVAWFRDPDGNLLSVSGG